MAPTAQLILKPERRQLSPRSPTQKTALSRSLSWRASAGPPARGDAGSAPLGSTCLPARVDETPWTTRSARRSRPLLPAPTPRRDLHPIGVAARPPPPRCWRTRRQARQSSESGRICGGELARGHWRGLAAEPATATSLRLAAARECPATLLERRQRRVTRQKATPAPSGEKQTVQGSAASRPRQSRRRQRFPATASTRSTRPPRAATGETVDARRDVF